MDFTRWIMVGFIACVLALTLVVWVSDWHYRRSQRQEWSEVGRLTKMDPHR